VCAGAFSLAPLGLYIKNEMTTTAWEENVGRGKWMERQSELVGVFANTHPIKFNGVLWCDWFSYNAGA